MPHKRELNESTQEVPNPGHSVGAGEVWSGVGTLVVARGGLFAVGPLCGRPWWVPRSGGFCFLAVCLDVVAVAGNYEPSIT